MCLERLENIRKIMCFPRTCIHIITHSQSGLPRFDLSRNPLKTIDFQWKPMYFEQLFIKIRFFKYFFSY